MKKSKLLIIFIFSFLTGFIVAFIQSKPQGAGLISFYSNNILPTDKITIISNGDIYQLSQNAANQITHNQNLIEPVAIGNNFVAITKTTNNSSLIMFDKLGNKIKTLFDGNNSSFDTMSWIGDPAVNASLNRIAYVSDKDKIQTNIPDTALYVLNLDNEKSTNIANPAAFSGGITHPIFDPIDSGIVLYDYYQYDPQTSSPYSTIEQFDNKSGQIKTLTFENKNAYQESISPDGQKILFLGRNGDSNTVTLFIGDYDIQNGISNMKALLTGDVAYPVFSKTKNHIYYLYSQGNKGYNLITATVQNNKVVNIRTVISGFQLLGNSSFVVDKN